MSQPVSVSNSKTVTKDVAPHLSAAALTTLLATPIESLTVSQFNQIADALNRLPKGHEGSQIIGTLLV